MCVLWNSVIIFFSHNFTKEYNFFGGISLSLKIQFCVVMCTNQFKTYETLRNLRLQCYHLYAFGLLFMFVYISCILLKKRFRFQITDGFSLLLTNSGKYIVHKYINSLVSVFSISTTFIFCEKLIFGDISTFRILLLL